MPPYQRNRYDSFLIWLYAHNKEDLIPMHIKHLVPSSTASTWRSLDFSSLVGHELRDLQHEAVSEYELLQKHKTLKKTVYVITRTWLAVSTLVTPILLKQKEHTAIFISEIQRLFAVVPKKMAFRIARISISSFYAQLSKMKLQCKISPLQLCIKRHPLQLATDEVKKIKALFAEPAFACWPAIFLYYEGLRNRGLYISLSTFYKYVNLLGLKRKWKKHQANKNGLKAFFPNQYLHVDTTIWKLDNGTNAFIALVSDNFSKMIIGWSVSLQNKAMNVKQALDLAVKNIHQYHPNHVCSTLVADGGSENHATTIEELLRQTDRPEITKVVALKDIRFSNSPVEAVNKIMKRYLRHHAVDEYDRLKLLLPEIINNYKEVRPHDSLNGLTPIQAYTNPNKTLDFKVQFQQAKSLTIVQNRMENCLACR